MITNANNPCNFLDKKVPPVSEYGGGGVSDKEMSGGQKKTHGWLAGIKLGSNLNKAIIVCFAAICLKIRYFVQ